MIEYVFVLTDYKTYGTILDVSLQGDAARALKLVMVRRKRSLRYKVYSRVARPDRDCDGALG